MANSEPATVILPFNLGAASKYEEHIFPLAYHHVEGTVEKGRLLLSATLDEMINMAEMGIDLDTDTRFRVDFKVELENLEAEEARLKIRPKSLNPLTIIRHYRAKRMFHAASKALFIETKRTSERIRREERLMRVVPSTELRAMSDGAPQGANIDGIAVSLSGPFNDEVQQKMLAAANAIALRASASDPFIDNLDVPQLSDDDRAISLADTASLLGHNASSSDLHETEPLIPRPPSYNFYFYNSLLATGSNIQGTTLNHGFGNRGSTTNQHPPP